jgi:predicted alpha/beta hydrolase family esterase
MAKTQIIAVDGGHVFENYENYLEFLSKRPIDLNRYTVQRLSWKQNLQANLGDDYQVIVTTMPDRDNAQYPEWKIWFERFLSFIDNEVILVGHSLGGTFLLKYLSENIISHKFKAVFLVAPAYSKIEGSTFEFTQSFSAISNQTDKIFLYHSKDDAAVPFSDSEIITEQLPTLTLRVFEDRGHFNQSELPEIIEDIRNINSR